MRCPFVAAGIEQRGECSSYGIDAADVGAFEGIAAKAAQGEIAGDGRAVVLLRADVVDLEGPVVEFLGELAVFTAAIGPTPHLPDKGCIHAGAKLRRW